MRHSLLRIWRCLWRGLRRNSSSIVTVDCALGFRGVEFGLALDTNKKESMADGICLQINWIAHPRVQTRSAIPQKTSLKTCTASIAQVCVGPRLQWWRRSTLKQVNNRNYRLSTASAQSRHGNNNDGNESDDAEGRSSWSPRDDYGLYPWDPSWELPEQNGMTAYKRVMTCMPYHLENQNVQSECVHHRMVLQLIEL